MKSNVINPIITKKLSGIAALAIVLLSAIWLVHSGNGHSQRKAYESFLKNEYKNVPELSKEALKQIPKFDRPDLAAIQNYYMTIDPQLKRVPQERLVKAWKQTVSLQKAKSPFKVEPITWQSIPADMGGRTRTLMFDPNDPTHKKAWAGSVTGGLWHNPDITDVHNAWEPVNDFWPSLSISSMTSDPQNPMIFYLGTGEPFTAITTYRESSGRGIGLMKSTDGGETWDLVESTSAFAYITDIVIRVEEGVSVIYMGVVSGKYKGADHLSQPSEGIFRSANGGETWEQVLPNIPGIDRPFSPADIALGANDRLIVGTMPNIDQAGGAYILSSDTGLPGSWTVFDDYHNIILNETQYNKPGRIMLASAPSDRNVVYAIVGSGFTNPENGFNYFYGNYILKSVNNGDVWTETSVPEANQWGNWATIAWHAFTVEVDPNNPNHVLIGGLDVYHTFDGGDSWSKISDWSAMYNPGQTDDYVHADIHTFKFFEGSSDTLIIGTDGGVFNTKNASDAIPIFAQNNIGYNTLQFYSADFHPDSTVNFAIGGLQDNGTVYWDGYPITYVQMISGGDGAYCFIDKVDPQFFITSVYYNYYFIYENYNNLGVYNCNSGIFINPADYNATDKTLYANACKYGGLYADEMLRIKTITTAPEIEQIPLNTGVDVPFSAVTLLPGYNIKDGTTLFLGTQSGQLFRIDNADAMPVATEMGSPDFPTANVSCIAVYSADTILVTFSNYGVPSVWITFDGGQNWIEKEGNLPDMPVRWAIINPRQSDEVILATELGIWFTNHISDEVPVWEPVSTGMGNVRVDMLRLREEDNTIIAASHGRGLFTGKFVGTPDGIRVRERQTELVSVYPNPVDKQLNFELKSNARGNAIISIMNLNGQLISSTFSNLANSRSIDCSRLKAGTYILKIESEGTNYSARFVKK